MYKTSLMFGLACSFMLIILAGCRLGNPETQPTATPAAQIGVKNETQLQRDSNTKVYTAPMLPGYISPEDNPTLPDVAMEADMYAVHAPEFPSDLVWLNTDRPLTLAELRGKVVILFFWDIRCIDCVYSFQDLGRLQADFPDDLVIIGIHAFYPRTDIAVDDIQQALVDFEADYPVIHDQNLRLWYDWGLQGTPTLVIIDPRGAIYGFDNGANVYGTFKPIIKLLTGSSNE